MRLRRHSTEYLPPGLGMSVEEGTGTNASVIPIISNPKHLMEPLDHSNLLLHANNSKFYAPRRKWSSDHVHRRIIPFLSILSHVIHPHRSDRHTHVTCLSQRPTKRRNESQQVLSSFTIRSVSVSRHRIIYHAL